MEWVFNLYTEYLRKELKRKGFPPSQFSLQKFFWEILENGSIKILVQEPWMGTIRFKTLASCEATSEEAHKLYADPIVYLRSRYGGGKFKINFYHGMNFLATKNFKPDGEPLWKDLPELVEE